MGVTLPGCAASLGSARAPGALHKALPTTAAGFIASACAALLLPRHAPLVLFHDLRLFVFGEIVDDVELLANLLRIFACRGGSICRAVLVMTLPRYTQVPQQTVGS